RRWIAATCWSADGMQLRGRDADRDRTVRLGARYRGPAIHGMGPGGRGTGLFVAADPVSTLSAPNAVWAMVPAVDISKRPSPTSPPGSTPASGAFPEDARGEAGDP